MTTIDLAANALMQCWAWKDRATQAGDTEWGRACKEEEHRWQGVWDDIAKFMSLADMWAANDQAVLEYRGEPTCFLQVEVA